uniref:Sushi, von Willebrand factor type A, EGF and pentraxin domain-containing protein 1 n=1 Tax=Magallana gigas TaxID=29159 RepID=K1RHK1_MAGGI
MTSSNHSEDECLSLSDYTQPQPFRLYRRELPTVTEQIPGDGIDNDGDGLVDEEYCGFLWQEYNITDIDLDGSMNEDCKGCKEGEELSLLFVCKDCDFGKFREKESKIDFCQICPENHTTFNTRSNSSKDCVPICEEGTELNSTKETCKPCSIGFYKDVSANDVSVNKTDRFECKRCPGNLTTYSIKSTDISDCIGHCESGHYLYNNTCLPCEIGKYKNTSSRDISLDEMSRWHCLACEGQFTTISNGSKTCITDCTCPCNMVHVQRNYTSSELSKVIEKMKKELIVNKEQLSSTLRKKISVKDNRPSSQSIGSFGVVIIVFVFALLLAADVMILKNHISMLVRTLVDFAKRCSRN